MQTDWNLTVKSEIKVGNIGTVLEVTLTEPNTAPPPDRVPVNLTTATAVAVSLMKPTGGTIDLVAAIKNPPGTDGIITYTDNVGIFTVKGRWQIRGEANFTGGNFFQGSWSGFYVGA